MKKILFLFLLQILAFNVYGQEVKLWGYELTQFGKNHKVIDKKAVSYQINITLETLIIDTTVIYRISNSSDTILNDVYQVGYFGVNKQLEECYIIMEERGKYISILVEYKDKAILIDCVNFE